MAITIRSQALTRIEQAAIDARPREACGFLLGPAGIIDEALETGNRAQGLDRFELDAQVHLRLQRDLRDSGRSIIGIFHSHPRGKAEPSAIDIAQALYPGWIWLISAFDKEGTVITRAYLHEKSGGFRPLSLDVTG